MYTRRRDNINYLHDCVDALIELASGISECISKARDDEQDEFESMSDELAQETDSAYAIYALDKELEIFVDFEDRLIDVIPYLEEAAACGDDHDDHLPPSFCHDPFYFLTKAVTDSRKLMMSS